MVGRIDVDSTSKWESKKIEILVAVDEIPLKKFDRISTYSCQFYVISKPFQRRNSISPFGFSGVVKKNDNALRKTLFNAVLSK